MQHVGSVDFNAQYAQELGQEVYFVTERGVFELMNNGLKLIEIAPGLDIEKDILAHMDFKPMVAEDIKVTNPAIYHDKWEV